MLSAVEQLLKRHQGVNRGTSPKARKWFSHNIYYLYFVRKCNLTDLTERTKRSEQTKQNKDFSLIREILGDIIGCISLMVLFFVALFLAGVYQ
jgi:hypothetical protein